MFAYVILLPIFLLLAAFIWAFSTGVQTALASLTSSHHSCIQRSLQIVISYRRGAFILSGIS